MKKVKEMNVTVHGEHDGIVEVDSREEEKRRGKCCEDGIL